MGPHLACTMWPEGGPHLAEAYVTSIPIKVASWSIQPFDHNRHGPKIGRVATVSPLGELGPHLTQRGRGRGLTLC